MGVKSVEHMSKLAQELRSSMPPSQSEHPAAQSTAGDLTPAPRPSATPTRRVGAVTTIRRGLRVHDSADLQQLEKDYEEVKARYEELLKQNEALKADTRRRMESYIRREHKYQEEISLLRDELRRATAGLGASDERAPMAPLHAMHGQILDGLSGIQQKTAAVLKEQESDLLRAFRARLYDVQMELEAERSKKDDGALEWIERTRTLGKELDWSREEALRLDRTNQQLAKDNQRLRGQAKAQEDDRHFLLRQLVALKKDNARLRDRVAVGGGGSAVGSALGSAAEASALRPPASTNLATISGATTAAPDGAAAGAAPGAQPPHLGQRPATSASHSLSRPSGGGGGGGGLPASASALGVRPSTTPAPPARRGADGGAERAAALEARHRELQERFAEAERRSNEVVTKLKKMLEAERRALKALRGTHTRELQQRTELETFLRQCVADVKAQLDGASRSRQLDLAPEDRQRVLELLLSQERVVSLLYDKTFPRQPTPVSEWQGDLLVGPEEGEEPAEARASLGARLTMMPRRASGAPFSSGA